MIYVKDLTEDNSEIKYIGNYDKAIQHFNNIIRRELKEIGQSKLSKEIFNEFIQDFIDDIEYGWSEIKGIISRHYPFIIYYNKNDETICKIPYLDKVPYLDSLESYIAEREIILKEIEIEE